MTDLLDDVLDVWLPTEHAQTYQTRSAPLTTTTAKAFISVPSGSVFPDVQLEEHDGLIVLTVQPGSPARVAVQLQTVNAVAIWEPGSGHDHARLPASWEDPRRITALNGTALGALLTTESRAIAAWAADAAEHRILVRSGLVEENADLLVSFEVTEALEAPIRVVLSATVGDFADTVNALTDRIYTDTQPAPLHDELPILCTWYFQHLAVDGQRLRELAAPAAELGFKSIIVDDGWQTDETVRGYGTTGDWLVSPTKIGDAADLVRHYTAQDMRLLWWVGTPFVGYRSQAFSDTQSLFEEPALETAILDPADPENRSRLIERLRTLLNSSGAHGFKLDFIERFTAADPSADRAGVALLDELTTALRQDRSDLSIEYREPYVSPTAVRNATMVRVADCPMSPSRNRTGIADLRLATRGAAVHSDPVMWADSDSPSRVAQHLQNALFGVLQVSMDLTLLNSEHHAVLQFWMAFALEHRDVLLHSAFHPERPDLYYPVITARGETTVITGRFQPTAITVPSGDWSTWYLLNADDGPVCITGALAEPVTIKIHDATGALVSEERVPMPAVVNVPVGGLATFLR